MNEPNKNCEHVIGHWRGCDEGGLFTEADRKLYGDLTYLAGLVKDDENGWFNFCPRCGAPLDKPTDAK